jgi:hypothetical protein
LDNDGGIDIVVINKDGPAHLLRNSVSKRGNWITFRVLNRNSGDAINATVRIEAAGRKQSRQVLPNQGYCSSNDPRVHFGLAAARIVESALVRWRSGEAESFGPFEVGRIYDLREGSGKKAAESGSK